MRQSLFFLRYLALSLLAGSALAAPAEAEKATEPASSQHPLKKLAVAAAEAEIVIRGSEKRMRKERYAYRKLSRNAELTCQTVTRAIEKACHDERRMPEAERDERFIEEYQGYREDCERDWREDEDLLRTAGEDYEDLYRRYEQIRSAHRQLQQMAEEWKDAELDVTPLVPLYQAIVRGVAQTDERVAETLAGVRQIQAEWDRTLDAVNKGLRGEPH